MSDYEQQPEQYEQQQYYNQQQYGVSSHHHYSHQAEGHSSGQKRRSTGDGTMSRSVNDFDNESQLRDALLSFDTFLEDPMCNDILREMAEGEPVQKVRVFVPCMDDTSLSSVIVAFCCWILKSDLISLSPFCLLDSPKRWHAAAKQWATL